MIGFPSSEQVRTTSAAGDGVHNQSATIPGVARPACCVRLDVHRPSPSCDRFVTRQTRPRRSGPANRAAVRPATQRNSGRPYPVTQSNQFVLAARGRRPSVTIAVRPCFDPTEPLDPPDRPWSVDRDRRTGGRGHGAESVKGAGPTVPTGGPDTPVRTGPAARARPGGDRGRGGLGGPHGRTGMGARRGPGGPRLDRSTANGRLRALPDPAVRSVVNPGQPAVIRTTSCAVTPGCSFTATLCGPTVLM